jgi:four helix bundle protein
MRNADFGIRIEALNSLTFAGIRSMARNELVARTKQFALQILTLVDAIPPTVRGRAIAAQIVRSGTSVGANYRAACRAKSDKDFLNKMVILEEEADETSFWLELLIESGLLNSPFTSSLLKEADELTAIFTASGKTVRQRLLSVR